MLASKKLPDQYKISKIDSTETEDEFFKNDSTDKPCNQTRNLVSYALFLDVLSKTENDSKSKHALISTSKKRNCIIL